MGFFKIALILLFLSGCTTMKKSPEFSCDQLYGAHRELLLSNIESIEFRNKEFKNATGKYSAYQIKKMVNGQIKDIRDSIKLANGTLELSCTPNQTKIYLSNDLIPGLIEMQSHYEKLNKHLKEI